MKYIITGFYTLIQTLPVYAKFIIIALLVVVGGYVGGKYFASAKRVEVDRPGQCDYLIEQNKKLVDAFINIRESLINPAPTSFTESKKGYMLASIIDTIPRVKRTTAYQYQQIINMVLFKVDSVLKTNKLDSLRTADSLRKQRFKS